MDGPAPGPGGASGLCKVRGHRDWAEAIGRVEGPEVREGTEDQTGKALWLR